METDISLPCHDKKHVFKIIDFVKCAESARARDPQKVYTRGNCGNLYHHLKSVFNCAKPMMFYGFDGRTYSVTHIMTKIGTSCFDVCKNWETELPVDDPEYASTKREIALCSDNYTLNENPISIYEEENIRFERGLMQKTAADLREYVCSDEFLKS